MGLNSKTVYCVERWGIRLHCHRTDIISCLIFKAGRFTLGIPSFNSYFFDDPTCLFPD